MSPEEKEHLIRMKTLKVREGVPDDLQKAISTFIEQAVIVGEYELDHMPSEYMENLLRTLAKYPEHSVPVSYTHLILDKNELLEY